MDVFERVRPRLFGIAYRMLGSAAEADDVLQAAGRAPRRVLSIRLPGTTFAAFAAGRHLAGLPGHGTQTFDEWLASGAER